MGLRPSCRVPRLFDACVDVLVEYVECVETLWGIPDVIKVKLANAVCQQRKLTPEAAVLFVEGSPEEVVLPNCVQLDVDVMEDTAKRVASDRLERLELGSCGRGFTDAAAAALASKGALYRLNSLVLGGAYRLSDSGLTGLLRHCPALQRLSLPSAPKLSAATVEALPALLPGLRQLDLRGCGGVSGEALAAAIPQLKQLTTLDISLIPEVDDAVLVSVARAPALREVSVERCAVTDSAVAALAASAPLLTGLKLDDVAKLTDVGLDAVAGACRELKALSVRGCSKLSDEALSRVASRGSLVSLDVSCCDKAGPRMLAALALCCRETLEELDVSFCRRVSNKGLGLVADKCVRLRRLVVYGCTQITTTFFAGHSNDNLTQVEGMPTLRREVVSSPVAVPLEVSALVPPVAA